MKVSLNSILVTSNNMEAGTLYVVGTPIGNMQDLSPRAREVLGFVDEIACEDTRVTKKLLDWMEVQTPARSIHQHSSDADLNRVIDALKEGKNIAYASDAGTPNVSDPGGKLVARAIEAGVPIVSIPGPSAVMAALSICGFPADAFTFLGFPPHKKGRNTFFDELDAIEHTVVLFESKHRIEKTLAALPQERLMMVGRELTKMHERAYRGTATQVLEELRASSMKGEFVIVIAPKKWK